MQFVTVETDFALLGVLVAAYVACVMGEKWATPSMTIQPLHGASRGIRPSKAAASTMLRGRKRDLKRIARKESLEEYITGIPSLASKEANYVPGVWLSKAEWAWLIATESDPKDERFLRSRRGKTSRGPPWTENGRRVYTKPGTVLDSSVT